ncbi:MAG: hypothetical protein IKD77_04070 [Bacilli bacterium]|nr:hypothetical protein [Bacilli bacterium]
MERKNYLEEDLTKEEKVYFEKAVISARKLYIRKNYKFLTTSTTELTENLLDEGDSVLDIVIKKCLKEINSAIEFEKEFSNDKLYDFVKALSLDEKMMLFSLFKKNKSIRSYAKEKGLDKNTVKRRRDKLLKVIKNIIGDEGNV